MSHVTHMNESWHTYERVVTHIRIYVWHTYEWSVLADRIEILNSQVHPQFTIPSDCRVDFWEFSHRPFHRIARVCPEFGSKRCVVCCSELQSVAECCSVLQCVAVPSNWLKEMCSVWKRVAACCSVLQWIVVLGIWLKEVCKCVAACCNVLQRVAACCSVLQRVAACCSMLYRVAACCGVLLCVAVSCSVLQSVAMSGIWLKEVFYILKCVASCCGVLPCVTACYSVLQRVAVFCSARHLAQKGVQKRHIIPQKSHMKQAIFCKRSLLFCKRYIQVHICAGLYVCTYFFLYVVSIYKHIHCHFYI